MCEMGSHDPLGHFEHKLWPKEGPRIKLPIWLPTTKSREFPRFPCVQVAYHTLLKRCWQGLQLCLRRHLNHRFAHKVMGLQSCRSLNFGNFGNGSPGTTWHLGVGLVAKHIVYYNGEGDGFPQVRAVVRLLNMCLPMHQKCFSYAVTNLLFGLCKAVWIIKLIVNHHSPHPRALTHPYPQNVVGQGARPTLSPFVVFIFEFLVGSIKELRGASTTMHFLGRLFYLVCVCGQQWF